MCNCIHISLGAIQNFKYYCAGKIRLPNCMHDDSLFDYIERLFLAYIAIFQRSTCDKTFISPLPLNPFSFQSQHKGPLTMETYPRGKPTLALKTSFCRHNRQIQQSKLILSNVHANTTELD